MGDFPPPRSGEWSSNLCDCCKDCSSCWCSFGCPCVVVGRLVEIIDQGKTMCFKAGCIYYYLYWTTCCCHVYTCGYRNRFRAKYGLPAAPCSDCCVEAWCNPCSIAQQYRELQHRGINPATGWFANQKVYLQTAPAPQKMSHSNEGPSQYEGRS